MDEAIAWKEAKGGKQYSDSEDDTSVVHDDDHQDEAEPTSQVRYQSDRATPISKGFSHQRINLSLRRNIVSLADVNQHKPKPNYNADTALDVWLERALVAISPHADLILFAGHSPDNVVFVAKLRMEPVNQYVTKSLDIPLDYNEQITSLLCLPIMSIRQTALGTVDWTALVIGLSSGYVKFYTEQSICLLSLKFCDEPVVSIKCQTQKCNSNARSESHFPTIIDELLITHRTMAITLDGLGVYENLRIAKAEVVKDGSNYEPAYNLTNLPSMLNCQKWTIEEPTRGSSVIDADIFGTRKTTTFDAMKSESINYEHIPAKAHARTLAFVGRNPFVACYRESKDSAAHSYTEIIGSIFSLWNKPPPTRFQMTEVSRASTIYFFDKERLATSIVSSPDKRLAAVTDDFGRVMLVEVTNWLVIRMWKGYRSAQCGWVEVKKNPDRRGSPHASFLVIYAPKRGLVEIWSAQRGPRVAAFNVGKNCRLLYSGYKMLNMRAELSQRGSNVSNLIEQSYSSQCYLLNAKSETIFCIELPYTYSLCKYGDLKSRDHLLLGELTGAIQRDSEVECISEIVHRIALAESLERAIKKIAFGLGPDKIVILMENLINKIMKSYDNHSGEATTDDDLSIIELCKRLVRLCIIFKDLSQLEPHDILLPDVNQRLIDEYEEHPQEIDEFSNHLGWSSSEALRYLSLLALERSYRKDHLANPWPSMGEPLTWSEFISCFDMAQQDKKARKRRAASSSTKTISEMTSIKLLDFSSKFLNEDRVIKTALFMYNRLSENFYKSSSVSKGNQKPDGQLGSNYGYLDAPTRLALLFQFWLSTKLCNHWKMWSFLQNQVGQISDELKVIAMARSNDDVLIETWKRIYELILESDNLFASIIGTATIRSDTLRTIQDNEKREKLEKEHPEEDTESERRSSIDWECLCIDAERMSILSQQLEDVFLLNLLLRYSLHDGHLVDNYVYKVARISVANILRGGPTVVSELVAQWAAQSDINLKLFTQPYGTETDEQVLVAEVSDKRSKRQRSRALDQLKPSRSDGEEHIRELLHHTKTSFPCSLEPNVILLHCIWEFCRRWMSSQTNSAKKNQLLRQAYQCLLLLDSVRLRHKSASVAYKTFFQRTLERLVVLVESNSSIVSVKSSRLRDALTRKELNMGEDCLEEFVQFCCDISELMLSTCGTPTMAPTSEDRPATELIEDEANLEARLLTLDDWWSTPSSSPNSDIIFGYRRTSSDLSCSHSTSNEASNSLIKTTLTANNLLDVNALVELNKLANLMNLIFKLKIIKAYPLSLIGEDSRNALQLDSHQTPTGSGHSAESNAKIRPSSLADMRHKFARKCILSLVGKMNDEFVDFNDGDDEFDQQNKVNNEDIDAKSSTHKFTVKPASGTSKSGRCGNSSEIGGGSSSSKVPPAVGASQTTMYTDDLDQSDAGESMSKEDNNESMVLFACLLSLANEWHLNCDELHMELVFELYRYNHDKLSSQISNRVLDQQKLAEGLLKIASQRVLILFGLSPHVSGNDWRRRTDKWSIFQPNVAGWLKGVQQEEMRREIGSLSFSASLKLNQDDPEPLASLGLQPFILRALRERTKLMLENITNHLDGQAGRLAYDLLQLLESQQFDKLIKEETESVPDRAVSKSTQSTAGKDEHTDSGEEEYQPDNGSEDGW